MATVIEFLRTYWLPLSLALAVYVGWVARTVLPNETEKWLEANQEWIAAEQTRRFVNEGH